jgi:hypothetical protein
MNMLTKFLHSLVSVLAVFLLMTGYGYSFERDSDTRGAKRVRSANSQKHLKKAKNWYIRLKVEAPEHGFIENSSLLGQIRKNNAATQYSLKALAPFEGNYLYITFIDPEGVDESGEYKTSFHSRTRQTRKQDSWEFTVKSSDPNNDIILSWSDLSVLRPYVDEEGRTRFHEQPVKGHRLGERMKLIDSLTYEEVPMIFNEELQSYSFNMQGMKERSFIWILEKRGQRTSKIKSYSQAQAKERLIEVRGNAKRVKKYLKQLRITDFDLNKPPLNTEME